MIMSDLISQYLDDFITLGLMSASDTSYHKIPAGCAMEIVTTGQDVHATGGAFSAFVPFTSISVLADTAACQVGLLAF